MKLIIYFALLSSLIISSSLISNFSYANDNCINCIKDRDTFFSDKITHNFANGDSYTGQIKNSNMHGFGIYKFANGNKYTGDFINGKRNGRGTYTSVSGIVYTGEWLNDNYHGQGTLKYSNGGKYKGNWVSGKRHGRGEYTSSEGDTYVGEWREDMRNGQGRQKTGDIYQSGQWVNDKFIKGETIELRIEWD